MRNFLSSILKQVKNGILSIWQNDFLKGGILLTAAAFAGNVLNYFFNFIVAHSLGPKGYGEIVAFNTYLGLTSIPITILSTVLIQKISSSGERAQQMAGQIEYYFKHRIRRWWFIIAFLFFLIPFTPQITNINPAISYFLIPTLIVSVIASFYGSSLQALRLFGVVAAVGFLAVVLKLLGAAIGTASVYPLTVIGLFLASAALVTLFAYYRFFHQSINKKGEYPDILEKRLKHIFLSRPFVLVSLSVLGFVLFGNIDILFVKKFFNPIDAGLYSSWNLLSKIIFYVLGPVVSVSFVFFSSEKGRSSRIVFYTLGILCLISATCFIAYSLVGEYVLSVLFGTRFLNLVPHLPAASVFGFFYATIVYLNNYFLAKKHIGSLLLAVTLPVYLLLLVIYGKNISLIMTINIFYAAVVAFLSVGMLFVKKGFKS